MRTHASGAAFHVTALTQSGRRWFTEPLRDTIVDFICEASVSCSTQVLALAVMPNHLHIILRQGSRPLGWIMQRILQRTALLVRRTYNHRGHVFGRRYWSGLCRDAAYLRQVIIYTHLNPYYSRLCKEPGEYRWTSHNAYLGLARSDDDRFAAVHSHHGLSLFASADYELQRLRSDYMCFIRHWMKRPKLPLGARYIFTKKEIATAPMAEAGDLFWRSEYGDIDFPATSCIPTDVDVRDRAVTALRAIAKDLTLDQLRTGGRTRSLCAIRRQLISMLLMSGCRNGAIARCLNVSTSLVSVVSDETRRALLRPATTNVQ